MPSLPSGRAEETEPAQPLLDEQRRLRRLAAHSAPVDMNADTFGETPGQLPVDVSVEIPAIAKVGNWHCVRHAI